MSEQSRALEQRLVALQCHVQQGIEYGYFEAADLAALEAAIAAWKCRVVGDEGSAGAGPRSRFAQAPGSQNDFSETP